MTKLYSTIICCVLGSLSEAFVKVYEITAFFDTTLIAALVTIYAIILAVRNRLSIIKKKIEELEIQETIEKDFSTIVDKLGSNVKKEVISKKIFGKESYKIRKDLKDLGKRLSHPWILTIGFLFLISLVLSLGAIIMVSENHLNISLITSVVSWILLLIALALISLTLRQVSILAGGPLSKVQVILREQGNTNFGQVVSFKPNLDKLDELQMPGKPDIYITFSQKGILNKSLVLNSNKKEPVTMLIWSKSDLEKPFIGLKHPLNVTIHPMYDLKFHPKETQEYQNENAVAEVREIPLLSKSSITLVPLIFHTPSTVPFHVNFSIVTLNKRKAWAFSRLVQVEE